MSSAALQAWPLVCILVTTAGFGSGVTPNVTVSTYKAAAVASQKTRFSHLAGTAPTGAYTERLPTSNETGTTV